MTTPTSVSKSKRTDLIRAKKTKNDEFYTRYETIKGELDNYWLGDYPDQFRGLSVYLNADSEKSNFWAYFVDNFDAMGLKSLTATHYKPGGAYILTYDGESITKNPLKGDGDFRSPECLALLDECDLVVTNPPFSLFRAWWAEVTERKKKFLVMGGACAVTKSVAETLNAKEAWCGANSSKAADFDTPNGITPVFITWWTNLNWGCHPELPMTKYYYGNESEFPEYDNVPGVINTNKLANIPPDYFGLIGVPITVNSKRVPDQIEVVNARNGNLFVNGRETFRRASIRLLKGHFPLSRIDPELATQHPDVIVKWRLPVPGKPTTISRRPASQPPTQTNGW